jgi:uroporphyrinogen III methyltransferase/synthase
MIPEMGHKEAPLSGKRVIVTRSRSQASEFSELLRQAGAEPVEIPVIDIGPPENASSPMRSIYEELERFDWIVFTSINGFHYFRELLMEQAEGEMTRLRSRMENIRIAAVGSKTAEAIENGGWTVHLIPASFSAESLLEAIEEQMERHVWKGKSFLFPKGDLGKGSLPQRLKELGMDVTEVRVYVNRPNLEAVKNVLPLMSTGQVDYVTFTSSSTVRNFLQGLVGVLGSKEEAVEQLRATRLVAIGPSTLQTLQDYGITHAIMAKEATLHGLIQVMVNDLHR